MVHLKQKAPARGAFIFNILFPADGNGAFKVVINEFFNFGGLIDFLQLLNARVGGIFLFGYKNVDGLMRGSAAFSFLVTKMLMYGEAAPSTIKESVMGFSPAGRA